MKQKKKELMEAIDSLHKLENGCFQLVHQYLNDRSPNALEFFLKQTEKLKAALYQRYEQINKLDDSKFKNPKKAINQIWKRADQGSKAIVFDFSNI